MDELLQITLSDLPRKFWLAALNLRNHVIYYDDPDYWAEPFGISRCCWGTMILSIFLSMFISANSNSDPE